MEDLDLLLLGDPTPIFEVGGVSILHLSLMNSVVHSLLLLQDKLLSSGQGALVAIDGLHGVD
jgi:hypothetical protein